MGEQRSKKISDEDALKDAENTLKAIKTESTEKEESGKDEKALKSVKKEGRPKKRSEKYKKAISLIDRSKYYSLEDAIELLKKTSYSKFEGSVEVHIRLAELKKGENIRGLIQFPHGTGKEVKVTIIDDKLIDKIIKDKRTDYDILLATPDMMPKIARIAKILGPIGKMPNPKSGTVTSNPEKSLDEIKKGRSEYKTDKQNIIHLVVGKTSWDTNKLEENYNTLINALSGKKLHSVTICATMSPGIKIVL